MNWAAAKLLLIALVANNASACEQNGSNERQYVIWLGSRASLSIPVRAVSSAACVSIQRCKWSVPISPEQSALLRSAFSCNTRWTRMNSESPLHEESSCREGQPGHAALSFVEEAVRSVVPERGYQCATSNPRLDQEADGLSISSPLYVRDRCMWIVLDSRPTLSSGVVWSPSCKEAPRDVASTRVSDSYMAVVGPSHSVVFNLSRDQAEWTIEPRIEAASDAYLSAWAKTISGALSRQTIAYRRDPLGLGRPVGKLGTLNRWLWAASFSINEAPFTQSSAWYSVSAQEARAWMGEVAILNEGMEGTILRVECRPLMEGVSSCATR